MAGDHSLSRIHQEQERLAEGCTSHVQVLSSSDNGGHRDWVSVAGSQETGRSEGIEPDQGEERLAHRLPPIQPPR